MMHQFFGTCKHLRTELVADPIEVPEDASRELWRWAVFCSASVVYLCRVYEVSCPSWAQESRFTLADPWFMGIGADLPHVQEKLRKNVPTEFALRNIFCSDRIYANKYEYRGRITV